jgi:DNA-directed RNA polymerase specialized sigma24 family protein
MAKEGPATLDDLLKQAKTTNRLLAAQLKAQMSQMDVIRLLSDLGLTAREIGEILGTSAGTVAVTQQRLRAKKSKKPEE